MIHISEGYRIISENALFSYLQNHHMEFIPPLSEQVELRKYASKLYDFAHMLVAFVDKKIIGICLYYDNDTNGKAAFLSVIHIQSDQHGRGLSTELMNRMIANLRKKTFLSLSLEVSPENLRAISYYTRFGFLSTDPTLNPIKMKFAI